MITQRYLLPVSLAAAAHAALFVLCPVEPAPIRTRTIMVALPPIPPQKPDEVAVPPSDDPTSEVRVLRGSPPPPDIPETSVGRTRVEFPSDPVERPRGSRVDTRIVPQKIGDGGSGAGDDRDELFGPFANTIQLDRVPHARVQMPPDYPAALRQAGITGTVRVEFDVDTTGRVTAARVLHSTNREFDDATIRAVLRWQFEPGKRHGRAVPFRMAIPVDFHLEGT